MVCADLGNPNPNLFSAKCVIVGDGAVGKVRRELWRIKLIKILLIFKMFLFKYINWYAIFRLVYFILMQMENFQKATFPQYELIELN